MTVDQILLVCVHAMLIVLVIGHMNAMNRRTPSLEVVAWWGIGMGSASETFSVIFHEPSEWGSVMFALGTLFLVVIHTRPEWRPILNDRRGSREPFKLPPECDRRCMDRKTIRKGDEKSVA